MVVPVGVIELNEPHTPLDQPTGQQAVVANSPYPAQPPYNLRVTAVSEPRSISSGALDCMRYATS